MCGIQSSLTRILIQSNLSFHSEMSFTSCFCDFILIGFVITNEYPLVSDLKLFFTLGQEDVMTKCKAI